MRYLCIQRDEVFPNLGFYRQLVAFGVQQVPTLHQALCNMLDEGGMAAADAKTIASTLSDEKHADVDLDQFRAWALQTQAERGWEGPMHEGMVLWREQVVAREPLELVGPDGLSSRVEARDRIFVTKRAELGEDWLGVHGGIQGHFARSKCREMDCDSSEDEDSYQGCLGVYNTNLDDLNAF